MSHRNPSFTEVQVKECIKIIRKLLEHHEILDLAFTVTNRTVKASSVKEALKAIISFSDSPKQLLNRKKITRNLLMQYAFNENICISASANKKEIVRKILEHWNKQLSSCDLALPSPESMEVNTSIESGDLPAFGSSYATWFYKMLNAQNQNMMFSDTLDFGPQHFWPKAVLQMNTMTDSTVMGAERIANSLSQLMQEDLYFHVNFHDDVRTKKESHGLIYVFVRGTVHKEQNCLGPFEQMFTLLQNPLNGNNWKIKDIWLNVRASVISD